MLCGYINTNLPPRLTAFGAVILVSHLRECATSGSFTSVALSYKFADLLFSARGATYIRFSVKAGIILGTVY